MPEHCDLHSILLYAHLGGLHTYTIWSFWAVLATSCQVVAFSLSGATLCQQCAYPYVVREGC